MRARATKKIGKSLSRVTPANYEVADRPNQSCGTKSYDRHLVAANVMMKGSS